MSENYRENFEKSKMAGEIAAKTLDEVKKLFGQEFGLMKSINYVTNLLMIMVHTQPLYSTEDFPNRVALLQIMWFVMEFPLKRFLKREI